MGIVKWNWLETKVVPEHHAACRKGRGEALLSVGKLVAGERAPEAGKAMVER